MKTLELSVFDHGPAQTELLRKRLAEFETFHRIKVDLEVYSWEGAWERMVQIALYKDGPDISELGSTWVGDFMHMNALRPYTPKELINLGGENAYLKPSWQSGSIYTNHPAPGYVLWGFPWTADVRVIAYRRDMFAQAGVDIFTAFQNTDTFEQTLTLLQESGVVSPLVFPTLRSRVDLQILASWVWGEGGAFLNEKGDDLLFDCPEALRGFQRFFQLERFLSDEMRGIDDAGTNEKFFEGEVATILGGHWLLLDPRIQENLSGNVGMVGIPPTTFVGGTQFVIWQYSRKPEMALELIDFLAGSKTSPDFYPGFGLPTRLDVIENADFLADSNIEALVQAALGGRAFKAGRLWGMIEKRLVDLIPVIWQEIFSADNPDVKSIVTKRISALANRLRMTINS